MSRLTLDNGAQLAYEQTAGSSPGILFCSGLKSDMTGTKATALHEWAETQGIAFTRFDYSGHGASSGHFSEGTIGQWMSDALAILDQITSGPQIIIGSSMGGWIMLLLALARPERVAGLVGIASAPDFPEKLIWQQLTGAQRSEFEQSGILYLPSSYSEPYAIRHSFIQESRQHHLLDADIAIDCPVRLLHGMNDTDVPWQFSTRIAEQLTASDVEVRLLKDGDHRLSNPAQIALLIETVAPLHKAHCND